jgi:hypothetical protein
VEDVVRLFDHSVGSIPVVSGDEAVVFHFLHKHLETDHAYVSRPDVVTQQPSTAKRFITTGFDDRSTGDNRRLKKTKCVTFAEMDEVLVEVLGKSFADYQCADLVLSPEEMVINIISSVLKFAQTLARFFGWGS